MKTFSVWFVLVLVFMVFFALQGGSGSDEWKTYAEFLEDVEAGEVAEVRVHNNEIHVELWQADISYSTLGVVDDALTLQLSEQGAAVTWGEPRRPWRTVLVIVLPLLLLVGLLWLVLKKAGAGQQNILSLTKSTARVPPEESRVTFDDVGGCEEAKELLGDLVDFLGHPERWTQAGVRLPRGVLLEGPPGCGKTLLARAVAGETKAKFFTVSASEFVEMFVGVGAARVRDMFTTAAQEAPAVVFIDELDAVGRRRGSGIGAGHDEREQTLNQLLVSLDGFEPNARVVVIGATNRPDVLDPALLRPGRFDRRIKVPEPSRGCRLQMLQIHVRNKPLVEGVDLELVADRTAGFTGADLENLANEATLLAVRRAGKAEDAVPAVTLDDFLEVLAPSRIRPRRFDKLDAAVIESATQFAEPTGKALVRVQLLGGARLEGELVWVDATFLKLRTDDESDVLVPKCQVQCLAALAGTESVACQDIVQDSWAFGMPELA